VIGTAILTPAEARARKADGDVGHIVAEKDGTVLVSCDEWMIKRNRISDGARSLLNAILSHNGEQSNNADRNNGIVGTKKTICRLT
jgi:hypothetical protein